MHEPKAPELPPDKVLKDLFDHGRALQLVVIALYVYYITAVYCSVYDTYIVYGAR